MSNNPQDTNSEIIYVAIACIFVIGGSIFYNAFKVELVEFWRLRRIYELSVISWIPGLFELKDAVAFLKQIPASLIDDATIKEFDAHFGQRFGWIPGVILLILGVKLIVKGEEVSETITPDKYLKRMSEHFSYTKRYISTNPAEMEINFLKAEKEEKHHAKAMDPLEFATVIPPVGLEKEARAEMMKLKENPDPHFKPLWHKPIYSKREGFDLDLAERVFRAQLGKPFMELKDLNEHERKLFDSFCTKMSISGKDISDYIFKYIEIAVHKRELDKFHRFYLAISRVHGREFNSPNDVGLKLLKKLYRNKKIMSELKMYKAEQIMRKHGFIRTGLMSLLQEARKTGIVRSFEYISLLKPIDRILWYCISTVGRKVSFVECAGCYAHWMLECQLGHAIHKPEVYSAVDALNKQLKAMG